jgi:hypothetical protein
VQVSSEIVLDLAQIDAILPTINQENEQPRELLGKEVEEAAPVVL